MYSSSSSQPVRANCVANLRKDRHPRQLWKVSRVDAKVLEAALKQNGAKKINSFSLSPPLYRWTSVQMEKHEAERDMQGLDLAGNPSHPRDVSDLSTQQIDNLLQVSFDLNLSGISRSPDKYLPNYQTPRRAPPDSSLPPAPPPAIP
jgi:hypothetical protein